MKKTKDDNPLILATAEYEAAHREFDSSNERASYERLCGALSAVCEAYLQQHSFNLNPLLPFPLEAARRLHLMLEALKIGQLSPMASALAGRSGRRWYTVDDVMDIKWARLFWHACEKGWVDHPRPVAVVAEMFGESSINIVRGWRRKARKEGFKGDDLSPNIVGKEARAEFVAWLLAGIQIRGRERIARKQKEA